MFKTICPFIIGGILLFSCKKEEEILEFPIVQTGAVTQVNDSSVVFHAKIMSRLSGNETDHGFVWDIDSLATIETAYSKSLGPVNNALFSADIGSYFVDGQKYFVRAYVITSEMVAYGRAVSFTSKGGGTIEAQDFYPKTAGWGDTISIKHKNISYKKGETKVFFNAFSANIIDAQDSIIQVVVPATLNQSLTQIKITVGNAQFLLQGQFELLPMIINDFEPKLVTFRDVITIHGQHFNPVERYSTIYLNGVEADVVSCGQNTIKVTVPDQIKNTDQTPSLRIKTYDRECSSTAPLIIHAAEIIDFSPDQVDRRYRLTITGQYFNPTANKNKVFIGNVQAKVLSATATEIVSNIPNGVIHGENKLIVEVADTATEASNRVFVYEPWKKLKNFPGKGRTKAFSYATNTSAYVGGGENSYGEVSNELWEYHPDTDTWTKKSLSVSTNMMGFTYQNIIYHMDGNQLYLYNPMNDTRELVSVCNGISNPVFKMGFIKDDIAYFINSSFRSSDLWKYNFTNNEWSEEAKKLSVYSNGSAGIINGEDVFYLSLLSPLGNKISKFDFVTENFVDHLALSKSDYLRNVFDPATFSIDNYSYIIDGHDMYSNSLYNRMIRYDQLTNTYNEFVAPPFSARTGFIGFSIGKKGYCGLGGYNNDFWEFDPEKMKPE